MEVKLPLVSVLMTSYNREKYIAEAIESVLASTYTNFELIIVDDGSKDRTVEIAQQYQNKDKRIKLFVNEKNLGDYPNRNKAASFAQGKYLKYVDSDDIIYPHCLQVMVWAMEKFENSGLGLVKLSTQENILPIILTPSMAYEEEYFGKGLLGNAPGSAIILKEAFDKLGGFSGLRYIGDYEFWLKISSVYPTVLIPGYLGWDRAHPEQESKFDLIKYWTLGAKVSLNALSSVNCPLNSSQVIKAKKYLFKRHKKILFKYLLLRLKIRDLIRYQNLARLNEIDLTK
jgi:Glycosyltransferases involved in cell wall biogenesis